jgi:hypothetical protein
MKIIYFSDYIKAVSRSLRFAVIVFLRFLLLLFKWRKTIHLIQLNYTKKYQFTSSYLVVRYKFKNTLWYKFQNIKKTTDRDIIVLSLDNIPVMPIKLVVYGFFRTKTYFISVVPEHELANESFKIVFTRLEQMQVHANPIHLAHKYINTKIPQILIQHKSIKFQHPSYNQTDFI